jgi:tetratricopeptide (TPR) repeat protein
MAWLDAERPVLLKLIDHAAAAPCAHAWQLTWILRRYLNNCGYQDELLASQRTALAAARQLGDGEAQAYSHLGLGHTCIEVGDFPAADENLARALAAFREAGHHVGEAYATCAVGTLHGAQDQHSEAITATQYALSLAGAFPAEPGMEFARLTALNNIAWQYACAGKLDEALPAAATALGLFRQAGDPELTACALDTLGLIQHRLGNHTDAIASLREALDLFTSLNSLNNSAQAAENLADAYQALGDPANAGAALRHALTALDQLRHPRATQIRSKLHDLDQLEPAAPAEPNDCPT